MALIIGITGGIGQGKSTLASHLLEKKFTEYAMAIPIKEMAKAWGFKHEEVYGTQEEKLQINDYWGISGREFMQKMGTEIGREILPKVIPGMNLGKSGNIWIRLFDIHIANLSKKKKYPKVVISDVRFLDEAIAIKEQNGFIIQVYRDTHVDETTASHSSETSMSDIEADYVINNNGSLEELFQNADDILADINIIRKKKK